MANAHRRRHQLAKIKINGHWVSEESEIKEGVVRAFQVLLFEIGEWRPTINELSFEVLGEQDAANLEPIELRRWSPIPKMLLWRNEVILSLLKSNESSLLCKLNIEKAYDHVNWDFLFASLKKIGFGEKWMLWIKWCISSARFLVLVDGAPTGFFQSSRGLRQGDPLSPFLFVIAMEALSCLLKKAKVGGFLLGWRVSGRNGDGVDISHLLFVDDTLVLCKLNQDQLTYFNCELIPVGMVENVEGLALEFGCKVGALPSSYLGLPLGALFRSVVAWDGVEERFRKKLYMWKSSLQRIGGLSGSKLLVASTRWKKQSGTPRWTSSVVMWHCILLTMLFMLLLILRRIGWRMFGTRYGLKQSPRAWFSSFSSVVQEFGMFCSTADHSVFYHHNSSGQCIYLVVYVDDIIITDSDQNGIQKLKQHLFTHFQTKDLGKLKYFLGIEIAQSSSGVVLSQRKYALDILEETGMLDCKPVDTPMDPNVKLIPGQGEPLGDPGKYRRLVGKLNYLTITRSDISFPVSVVSQFLQSPCDSHWDVVIRILQYIKSTPGQDADWVGSPTDRCSTSGYCVFIGGNLISWKSKKQDVVARACAEAEYRAMALATCELIWLKHLLRELRFGKDEQMKLTCDNQAALHIASNPVFHERTKHIEVDCHFIREKITSGCVATSFVNSNDQLADIFTKSLRDPRIKYICNNLGAYNIYAPS
uniref:Uncharacterized protein n=1 Tax=Vitis vinifera TaxID=29760 RepID=A5B2L7_VITVI|nr:hypothetical protein VITISV_025245 [Vitis vinifera]